MESRDFASACIPAQVTPNVCSTSLAWISYCRANRSDQCFSYKQTFKYGIRSELLSISDLADDADTVFEHDQETTLFAHIVLTDFKISSLHLRQKEHIYDLLEIRHNQA